MNYAQPKNLAEALGLLATTPTLGDPAGCDATVTDPWTILSGGTDFYPGSLERPMASQVMDIHALDELKTIAQDHSQVRIGAGVTWSDVIGADLPASFDALKLAAREVGSVQIQNKGTLVGNLCNASPAADGVPPLLILDALVELTSLNGIRQLPLQEFILGNRRIARKPNEMVTAIVIPANRTKGNSVFMKLGARKYLIISISMVAVRVACDNNNLISDVAVSVGSCSLVAQRLSVLEAALYKKPLSSDLSNLVTADHLTTLAPIDDVRSTGHYRMEASLELVRRSLISLASGLV
ncbi:MAG: xanthine dehydrogenase family protein subunit M [Granulosicoccus sp.]